MLSPTSLDADACYRALVSHDARFDSRFFTGVTSTGIYCRTVCRVRTPQQGNCRFFSLAAQAEAQGFRPCLRCRPELAPQLRHWSATDAAHLLAQAACQFMNDARHWQGTEPFIAGVANHLGISERHLHRVFSQTLGITPLQYWQTQRLLCAKQLLTDTALPIHSVATLAGFGSVRRFNAAMQTHYRLTPGALRKPPTTPLTHRQANKQAIEAASAAMSVNVTLAYRPPYNVPALLQFLNAWGIPGVEHVDIPLRQVTRTLPLTGALGQTGHGWLSVTFDAQHPCVHIRLDPLLAAALPQTLQSVRHWLDLDADPTELAAVAALGSAGAQGTRLPAAPVAFEWLLQTLLAQAPGCVPGSAELKQRLHVFVSRMGSTLSTPHAGVVCACPTPQDVMQASPAALADVGLTPLESSLLVTLASMWTQGVPDMRVGANVEAARSHLCTVPGLSSATVNWLLMRCLHWPDVDLTPPVRPGMPLSDTHSGERDDASPDNHAARPWRSYLAMLNWAATA